MNATAISSEFVNLKTRLKKTWMAGDYDRFSRFLEPISWTSPVAQGNSL
jgi:hypothetical protein